MNEKTEHLKKMAQEKLSCVHEYIDKAKSELDSMLITWPGNADLVKFRGMIESVIVLKIPLKQGAKEE